MSLKSTVQRLARRIHRASQGSTHVRSSSSSGSQRRSYRTQYQRYLWGGASTFIYFLFAILLTSGDVEGSTSNNGIIGILLGAIIFAAIGAYFAPGLTNAASRYTAHGRRKAAARALPRSKKRSSGSSDDLRKSTSSGSSSSIIAPSADKQSHSSMSSATGDITETKNSPHVANRIAELTAELTAKPSAERTEGLDTKTPQSHSAVKSGQQDA